MKDIIENRFRIDIPSKLRLLGMSLRENGFLWTSLIGLYYVASAVGEKSFSAAANLRRKWNLPGMNSVSMNKIIWESWDWSGQGEEWSPSAAWKKSVIDTLLIPNIPEGSEIVEVGPGGGRWTEELQRRAKKLTGIDISEACVRECKQRFAGCNNVEFRVGSGADLEGVVTGGVDAIWSFDVFVHINKPQFAAYCREFARVLRPGGVGVIHHGAIGGEKGGWRSNVANADVEEFLRSAGLDVKAQISSWKDAGEEFQAGLYDDTVTVFHKPPVPGTR